MLRPGAAHGYCVGLITPASLAGAVYSQLAVRSTPAKLAGPIAVRSTPDSLAGEVRRCSGVQVARRVVPWLDGFPGRLKRLTLGYGLWAARVKAAARGWMHGIGDLTL